MGAARVPPASIRTLRTSANKVEARARIAVDGTRTTSRPDRTRVLDSPPLRAEERAPP
jgi:hypothetical protein